MSERQFSIGVLSFWGGAAYREIGLYYLATTLPSANTEYSFLFRQPPYLIIPFAPIMITL